MFDDEHVLNFAPIDDSDYYPVGAGAGQDLADLRVDGAWLSAHTRRLGSG